MNDYEKLRAGDIVRAVSTGCNTARTGDICKIILIDAGYVNDRTCCEVKRLSDGVIYSQWLRRFVLHKKAELDLSHIKRYGIVKFLEGVNK